MNRWGFFRQGWLFLAIPVLTESLTTNQSFTQVFSPIGYFFLFFAYCIPVYLIYVLMVRWDLNVVGVFVLGLAYGIFNEGVLAKTLLMTDQKVPVTAFAGYDVWGVNLPWAMVIIFWHACHAVFYPVILARFLYPTLGRDKDFPRPGLAAAACFYLIAGSLFFLVVHKGTDPVYLFIFAALIIVLIVIARKWPKAWDIDLAAEHTKSIRHSRSLLVGGAMLGLFIIPAIIASLHWVVPLQAALTVILYALFFLFLKRGQYFQLPNIVFVALGDYVVYAAAGLMGSLDNMDRLAGEAVAICVLIILFYLVRKRDRLIG